jgi:hypothetical protein
VVLRDQIAFLEQQQAQLEQQAALVAEHPVQAQRLVELQQAADLRVEELQSAFRQLSEERTRNAALQVQNKPRPTSSLFYDAGLLLV